MLTTYLPTTTVRRQRRVYRKHRLRQTAEAAAAVLRAKMNAVWCMLYYIIGSISTEYVL